MAAAKPVQHSAFHGLFRNGWLRAAIAFPLALHTAVIYLPFLQKSFSTVGLSAAG